MKSLFKNSFLFYLLVFPLICMSSSCSANHNLNSDFYYFNAKVSGIGSNMVYLKKYLGSKFELLDSTKSDNGSFQFKFKEEWTPGMYHVRWGQANEEGIDFIYNYENINFTANSFSLNETKSFNDSKENELFYAFYQIKIVIENINNMKKNIIEEKRYEEEDKYLTIDKYQKDLEYSANIMLDTLDEESKSLFSYKLLKSAFRPSYKYYVEKGIIGMMMDPLVFEKLYYFDNLDFSDVNIVSSPFFINAIDEYFDRISMPPFIENNIEASNLIISKASINDDSYNYITDYLLKKFERSEFIEVYLHIMETYFSDICGGESDMYLDKKKLYDAVKRSTSGNKALNVKGVNIRGEEISLYDIKDANAIIILFYSLECGYCRVLVEGLLELAPEFLYDKNVEIFAFAITDEKDKWVKIIEEFDMSKWINLSDLEGKNSVIYDDFHIRGTPEVYLLDSNFIIYSRPSSVENIFKDTFQLLRR